MFVIIKIASKIFILFTLAILTQIGAVTYLLALIASFFFRIKSLFIKLFINILLYGLASFLVVPQVAPSFGRVPITIADNLKPANYWLTVGLNRNYVVPELNQLLQNLSVDMKKVNSDITLFFLDANFPFINRYPLIPHLSHHDGRKVDLAYLYVDEQGNLKDKTPSNSGYGFFEHPLKGERDTNAFCKKEGYIQYDYPKYLTLGVDAEGYVFSNKLNKTLLEKLLSYSEVEKVFIEPHLADRFELQDDRIRFHGCGAVRHDDHIHFQI